ncbi:hypothetical protein ACHAPC_003043 [Botrytis cinerea]
MKYDQNELLRFGEKIFDTTGAPAPTEKSLISSLATATGVGYNVARHAYVKSVLDPLLQEKVHKSMKWIINSNFVPEFIDTRENGMSSDDNSFEEDIIDPVILNADGVPRPVVAMGGLGGTFLADFTEFRKTTLERADLGKGVIKKIKEVESKNMVEKNLEEKKQDMGVDDLETPLESEANEINGLNLSNDSSNVDSILELENKIRLAETKLEKVTGKQEIINQIPGLRSAIEDLLPILEKQKPMYKIESSVLEAKKILRSGLFPSNGPKQYLWNDTVCINKGDANEQYESLAMMGQW